MAPTEKRQSADLNVASGAASGQKSKWFVCNSIAISLMTDGISPVAQVGCTTRGFDS